MKNLFLFVIVTLLLISSCGKKELKLDEEFTEKKSTELKTSTFLNFDQFRYNEKKLILTKKELVEQFGVPDTIYIGGAFQPKKFLTHGSQSSNTLISYDNFLYGPLKFAVWDDKARISFINFEEFADTIYHPKINLSNGTSIKEIKKKFPTGYGSKNEKMNSLFGINPEKYGLKKEETDWINFRSGNNDSTFEIELTFLKGELIWAYFEVRELTRPKIGLHK